MAFVYILVCFLFIHCMHRHSNNNNHNILLREQLLRILRKHGKIRSFRYLFRTSGRNAREPRGYAFVEYHTRKVGISPPSHTSPAYLTVLWLCRIVRVLCPACRGRWHLDSDSLWTGQRRMWQQLKLKASLRRGTQTQPPRH